MWQPVASICEETSIEDVFHQKYSDRQEQLLGRSEYRWRHRTLRGGTVLERSHRVYKAGNSTLQTFCCSLNAVKCSPFGFLSTIIHRPRAMLSCFTMQSDGILTLVAAGLLDDTGWVVAIAPSRRHLSPNLHAGFHGLCPPCPHQHGSGDAECWGSPNQPK